MCVYSGMFLDYLTGRHFVTTGEVWVILGNLGKGKGLRGFILRVLIGSRERAYIKCGSSDVSSGY